MKVQRIRLPESDLVSWMVLDNSYLPIQPIQNYLTYLENIEKSPNTVRNYAHHLKLFFEFLESSSLTWTQVDLKDIAEFIYWLRSPEPGVTALLEQESKRSERTVNLIISAVSSFYEYQRCLGEVPDLPLYRYQMQPRKYKNFLYHISKSKPVKNSKLKLKERKHLPETLTQSQVIQLIDACENIRDKFLIQLLYETGMRIGQALGLRHEDIISWDNEIQIVPRLNNINGARAKTNQVNRLTVSMELMGLYTEYLVQELNDIDSDYVFVNLFQGEIGKPMNYSSVLSLFKRLSKKVEFDIHAHMLRHTHATELIRNGMGLEWVQKRLGHASVQTTIDTYTHLSHEDLKPQLESFLERNRKDK